METIKHQGEFFKKLDNNQYQVMCQKCGKEEIISEEKGKWIDLNNYYCYKCYLEIRKNLQEKKESERKDSILYGQAANWAFESALKTDLEPASSAFMEYIHDKRKSYYDYLVKTKDGNGKDFERKSFVEEMEEERDFPPEWAASSEDK